MHTEPPLKGLVGSAELNLGAEAAELLQVVQCPQDPELGTSLCKGPTSSPLKNWAGTPFLPRNLQAWGGRSSTTHLLGIKLAARALTQKIRKLDLLQLAKVQSMESACQDVFSREVLTC